MEFVDPRIPKNTDDMDRAELAHRLQRTSFPSPEAVIGIGLCVGLGIDVMEPLSIDDLVACVRTRHRELFTRLAALEEESPSMAADSACWSCGTRVDWQASITGPGIPPVAGDVGICGICTQINIYETSDTGLTRRAPTDTERNQLLQDPVVTTAIAGLLDMHASRTTP